MRRAAEMKRIAAIIAVLVFTLAPLKAHSMLNIKANHDHIKVDFFYHGSTVSIKGASDPDVDLVIKIASADGRHALKQKGKVGGVLWMNVGDFKVDKVPGLYFIHSTKRIEDLLSPAEAEASVIGYPALKAHAVCELENGQERARWLDEFIKYKEHGKLYGGSVGKIGTKPGGGQQEFYINTPWPYQAAPGNYTVTVYAVKDQKVIEKAEANVEVEQAGLVKELSGMARTRPALYGLLSVGVALLAGFAVGLVFRKGGGAH